MKRRRRFVSNSSASSFLIIRADSLDSDEILLSPEIEKLLVDFGFKKVNCYYSDQVPGALYTIPKPPSKSHLKLLKKMKIKPTKSNIHSLHFNYGYDVTCNQDDVIYFLLKNNIPFEATIHYGHSTVIYKKNAKDFLTIQNFGSQACMTNWKKNYKEIENLSKIPSVTKTNVKKWLKQQKKWNDDYNKLMEEENAVLSILTKKK